MSASTPAREGAVVWCAGAFRSTNGKTAHGLVRRSERYRLDAVVDPTCAGRDAGDLLDGRACGVPVVADLSAALAAAPPGEPARWFVVGLAPDGGRLPPEGRAAVVEAIEAGLHVVSGLHDFLGEDEEIAALAARRGVTLTDVRRPPHRRDLHFFSGKIEAVDSLVVALLGTDSAVGKRTTAWMLVDALRAEGLGAELVGTGQTAWLQGARYSIVEDSLISDFMAGEIEHAVHTAWAEQSPDVIVLEGQGSLMNPAYPGGYELLAAGRPECVVLQHAPTRAEYDGFPGYPLHPIDHQIRAVEVISGRPVVAITVNHEGLDRAGADEACARLAAETGVPACAPLLHGVGAVVEALRDRVQAAQARRRAGAAGGPA